MTRPMNIVQTALGLERGTVDPKTLTKETLAKVKRLGPLTMGGESAPPSRSIVSKLSRHRPVHTRQAKQ